jgi:hypothetical protein
MAEPDVASPSRLEVEGLENVAPLELEVAFDREPLIAGPDLGEPAPELQARSVLLNGLPEGVSGYWEPGRRAPRKVDTSVDDLTASELDESRIRGYWEPRGPHGRHQAVEVSGDEASTVAPGGYWDRSHIKRPK